MYSTHEQRNECGSLLKFSAGVFLASWSLHSFSTGCADQAPNVLFPQYAFFHLHWLLAITFYNHTSLPEPIRSCSVRIYFLAQKFPWESSSTHYILFGRWKFSTFNMCFLHSPSPYYLICNLAILVTHFPSLRPITHFPSLPDLRLRIRSNVSVQCWTNKSSSLPLSPAKTSLLQRPSPHLGTHHYALCKVLQSRPHALPSDKNSVSMISPSSWSALIWHIFRSCQSGMSQLLCPNYEAQGVSHHSMLHKE